MKLLLFVSSILFVFSSHASEYSFNSDLLIGYLSQNNFANSLNPNNQIYSLPISSIETQLRPHIKLEITSLQSKFIMEPRLKVSHTDYKINEILEIKTGSEYYFNELFWQFNFSPEIDFSAGIINYQWGLSEVISASQFMFHELQLKPEPFQETKGLEMLKLQWLPSLNFSLAVLYELEPFHFEHRDFPELSDRTSKKRKLIRTEYSSDKGDLSQGLVIGQKMTDKERMVYGLFGYWVYNDFGQFYYDSFFQQGNESSYLQNDGLSLEASNTDKWTTLGALGHRLSFDGGVEWKIEYIQNDFGPDTKTRQGVIQQLESSPTNTSYYSFLNSEQSPLPGQKFLYNSLRWESPKILKFLSSSRIYLKQLLSLTDHSQLVSLALEAGLSDSLSLSLALINSIGENKEELSSALQSYESAYLKYSF